MPGLAAKLFYCAERTSRIRAKKVWLVWTEVTIKAQRTVAEL